MVEETTFHEGLDAFGAFKVREFEPNGVVVISGCICQSNIWYKTMDNFPDVNNHVPLTATLQAKKLELLQTIPVVNI